MLFVYINYNYNNTITVWEAPPMQERLNTEDSPLSVCTNVWEQPYGQKMILAKQWWGGRVVVVMLVHHCHLIVIISKSLVKYIKREKKNIPGRFIVWTPHCCHLLLNLPLRLLPVCCPRCFVIVTIAAVGGGGGVVVVCYGFKRLRQLSTVVGSKVQVLMSLEECKS